jgi:choline kinase
MILKAVPDRTQWDGKFYRAAVSAQYRGSRGEGDMNATKAIILAAGVGSRLGAESAGLPKALLRFGPKTLLQRHLEILWRCGVRDVVLGVGYQAEVIAAEAASAGPLRVRTVLNPDYRSGSVVTLASLAKELSGGEPVLLMDADVLYDDRMITRLQQSPHDNCLLLDRGAEDGDEPVKICVRGQRIVEFRKKIDVAYDFWGESVGFFRFSAPVGNWLASIARGYVASGRVNEPYEDAIRDMVLGPSPHAFGFEDVTGLPWVEIDFPEDVNRARFEIMPRLADGRADASK